MMYKCTRCNKVKEYIEDDNSKGAYATLADVWSGEMPKDGFMWCSPCQIKLEKEKVNE